MNGKYTVHITHIQLKHGMYLSELSEVIMFYISYLNLISRNGYKENIINTFAWGNFGGNASG